MCEWVQLGATLRAVNAAVNIANTAGKPRLALAFVAMVHISLAPTSAFYQFYFIRVRTIGDI